jgi:hypothetical protein
MGKKSNKVSFFRQLFIKPPTDDEMALRTANNRRNIVKSVGTGNYLLQTGRYMTEQDIAEKRKELLGK